MQWKQEHSAPHYVEEIGTVHLLTCQNVKVAAVLLSSGAVETAVRRRRALGEDLHGVKEVVGLCTTRLVILMSLGLRSKVKGQRSNTRFIGQAGIM